MSAASPAEVQAFLAGQLGDSLAARGFAPDDLPFAFDLLAEGVIDSFGFLELLLALEDAFGIELDLEGLDADDLTRLGPLSRYVALQTSAAGAAR